MGNHITSERTAINLQGVAVGIYTVRVLDTNGQILGVKRVAVQ